MCLMIACAEFFFEHLDSPADAQQGLTQVQLFGFEFRQHLLAGGILGV